MKNEPKIKLPIWALTSASKSKNRSRKWLLILVLLKIISISNVTGQSINGDVSVKIMSYNVENLFDNKDDSLTSDEEFLPYGDRHWTFERFNTKLNRIFQVIMSLGKGNNPAIIGLCEIENDYVLRSLLTYTPLVNSDYKIIHKESPDRRGIDVALLYRSSLFKPISYNAIPVVNSKDSDFKTRDILYVKGEILSDTIYLFVNHWPSKYGGLMETKQLRTLAAKTLKRTIDSIQLENIDAKIIAMGDFNDGPTDESICIDLGALNPTSEITATQLYSLAFPLAKKGEGTNKYQEKWDMIDQFIVSGTVLKGSGVKCGEQAIFKAPFLLVDDKTYLGKKPFRTYSGFEYINGFSDHLPIYITLTR